MKIFKLLSLTIVCGLASVSCDKDKKPIPEPNQINRVAAAAQHFVNAVDTASLADKVRQTTIIAQDFYALDDTVSGPFMKEIDDLFDFPEDTTVHAATETTRKLLEIEKEELLDLTKFAARYVMTQKGYTKEECDHIIIEVTGADGITSKLEIKYSGKNNTLLVDELYDEYWDYYGGEQVDVKYHSQLLFVLPGKLEVTLTHGKTKIASLTISDELEADTLLENPSIITANNSITIKITVGSYTASLYATTGDQKIKASASLKSGKTTMIGVSASVDGIVFTEVEGEYQIKDDVLGKASVSLDLMGEVQLKGSTPSVSELIKAAEFDDVRTVKQVVDDTNSKFNAGVYYNYGSHKHATIKAAAITEEADRDVNGDNVVDEQDIEEYAGFVVYFENNTAFSTLDSIFATEQFDTIINNGIEKLDYLISIIYGGKEEERER